MEQQRRTDQRGPNERGFGGGLRGGFNGAWRPGRFNESEDTTSKTQAPPLGELIDTIKQASLDTETIKWAQSASIQDCQLVSSFNWLDKSCPTVVTPGQPPLWTPLTHPRQLQEDKGVYFRDENAARYPDHPVEPAVRVALADAPTLPKEIEVFACASTIGNLLQFVRNKHKPFRMLLELVGDTLFLVRRENSPTETIQNVYGYGHTFPEAYTTWEADVKGSASHQRLIRYQFGKLNFVVRFESDGYFAKHQTQSEGSATTGADDEPETADENVIDALTKGLTQTHLNSQDAVTGGSLRIQRGGARIEQSFVFDLKTRSVKKQDDDIVEQELPRLWARQVQWFILAFHTRGVFKDIREIPVTDRVKDWERDHNNELARLAALVHDLIARVRQSQLKKLELNYPGHGGLEVRQQVSGTAPALSPQMHGVWQEHMGSKENSVSGAEDDSDGTVAMGLQDSTAEGGMARVSLLDEPWDDDIGDRDYTACSAEHCGYCGSCTY